MGTLCIFSGTAIADMPVVYKDGTRSIFQISAPDFWQVRAGGPRLISPPGSEDERLIARVIGLEPTGDKGAWVGFMSPFGVSNAAQAEEYLKNIGRSLVGEPNVTERSRIRVGGLPASRFAGTGRRDGKTVNFTAVIIDLPGNRVAVSLAVLESGANPGLVADINEIYGSFRSLR
ncbi:MAG: hypothetical protein AAF408_10180 [Pseudomonadota bacterium]